MRTRQKARLEATAQTSEEAEDFLSLGITGEEKDGAERDKTITSKPVKDGGSLQAGKKASDPEVSLCSSLDPGPTPSLYFSCDPDKMLDTLLAPKTRTRVKGQHVGVGLGGTKEDFVITADFERKECAPPLSLSRHAKKKMNQAARAASTGSRWFNMPAPQLTPQLKNDLKLLQMRGALDPARHYKANDSKKLPRYFQVGRVVADSADFYSGRIPQRQRKQTLVDELLSDEAFQKYHKKKYLELQDKFKSGTERRKNITFKKKFKKKF